MFEIVNHFVYLGVVLEARGGEEFELRARIVKEYQGMLV